VEDLVLHKVRTRLARCLLPRIKGDAPYAERWTQDELAAHIGGVRDRMTHRANTKETCSSPSSTV
jgi:hypothetical protein